MMCLLYESEQQALFNLHDLVGFHEQANSSTAQIALFYLRAFYM